jgi:O-antigen ligase
MFFLVAWPATQFLGGVVVPGEFFEFIRTWKAVIGPLCVLSAWLFSDRRVLAPPALRGLLALGLLLGISAAFRVPPNLGYAALSIAWGLTMAVILPSIVRRTAVLTRLLWWNTGVLALIAGLLLAGAVLEGTTLLWTEGGPRVRYTLAGANPLYAARIATALFLNAAALLFVFGVRHHRGWLWSVLWLSAWACVLTDTRTHMLFLVIFAAAFAVQFRGRARWISVNFFLLATIYAVLVFEDIALYSRGNAMDRLSSGRLSIWRVLAEVNLPPGDPLAPVIGNGLTRWPAAHAMTSGAETSTFFVPHADNLYVDVFFSSGAIGIAVMVWAFVRWFRAVAPGQASNEENARERKFIRASLIASAFAAATDTLFPSFGNLFNADVLVLLTAMTGVLAHSVARGDGRASALEAGIRRLPPPHRDLPRRPA